MNPKKLIAKTDTLGNIVKVQEIIEYIILAELMTKGATYLQDLEQRIIAYLDGVGANTGYLSQRTTKMIATGKIERIGTDPQHRSRQLLRITPEGIDYLKKVMVDASHRVSLAKKTYSAFETYMDKFNKMPLI
ncbi:hypothetical protein [Paenibacillus sp. GP183]|uniref:hypothetical protein n=1 Tax=Paenibacillus sp. GP183 TaxID=1882751 RepID=UPI000899DCAF|nr:hypothetical protein [Paenibacillus sp. GP183]SED08480.1 hypothetical protein SAMN05443246_5635 [Paenibacillus sp. GP183]